MSGSTIFYIPKKVKIGFQDRCDTFTGRLGFLTYVDAFGVLRKERSWNNWKNDDIPAIDIDNVPTSGFVFNRGVERYAHWGNSGRSMVRVHDPRGFEFEITVDNMLSIMSHSDVSRCDVSQECIYGWDGVTMALLPCNSESYRASIEFSDVQEKVLTDGDMVPGHMYVSRKEKTVLMYLGEFEWFDVAYNVRIPKSKGLAHVFYSEQYGFGKFQVDRVAKVSDGIDDVELSDQIEYFLNSIHGQPAVDFDFVEINEKSLDLSYWSVFFSVDKKTKTLKKYHIGQPCFNNSHLFRDTGGTPVSVHTDVFKYSLNRKGHLSLKELGSELTVLPVMKTTLGKSDIELLKSHGIGRLNMVMRDRSIQSIGE